MQDRCASLSHEEGVSVLARDEIKAQKMSCGNFISGPGRFGCRGFSLAQTGIHLSHRGECIPSRRGARTGDSVGIPSPARWNGTSTIGAAPLLAWPFTASAHAALKALRESLLPPTALSCPGAGFGNFGPMRWQGGTHDGSGIAQADRTVSLAAAGGFGRGTRGAHRAGGLLSHLRPAGLDRNDLQPHHTAGPRANRHAWPGAALPHKS